MKYKITYRYLTEGYIWLEARSKKEAEEKYTGEDMDQEEVIKWYKPKIELN